MKRKVIAAALILSMIASAAPMGVSAASVTDFKDVSSSKWYYQEVKAAVDDGYMNGVTSDTFAPSDYVSRAMFSVMIARFDKASVDNSAASRFPDVESGKWYTGSVDWADENGIINGCATDNMFHTGDNITREDVAVIIYRYVTLRNMNLKQKDTAEFKDAAQISDYAKEAMEYCRKHGIFFGDQNGYVYPKKYITRAEGAAVIERLKNIIEDSTKPTTPTTPTNPGSSSGGGGGGSSTTRYTITWHIGDTPQTTTVKRGSKIVPPVADADMTKEGYTFAGWSTDPNASADQAIATADLPDASSAAEYYPIWKKTETPVKEYTITWNFAGGSYADGSTSSTTVLTEGSAVTAPETAPTRTGYTLKGWAAADGGTQIVTFPAASADVTYYALWEADTYTVTWNPNYDGAAAIAPVTKKYGETLSAGDIPAPTRTGYDFTGWKDANGNSPAAGDQITGNLTYTASWQIKTYTITWNTDGASETVSPSTVEYGKSPTAPSVTKEGYTLVGWYDESNPSVTYSSDSIPAATGNVTYRAKWNQIVKPDVYYSITWYNNDGTENKTTTTLKENSAITAPAFTRTGYTFKGWSTAAGGAVVALPATITSDLTYYAVWEATDCTITWNLNYTGAAAATATTVKYDSAVTAPAAAPTRTGYTFKGWAATSGASASDVITTFPVAAGDTTYYAVWEKNTYTVSWYSDADTLYQKNSAKYEDALTAPAAPTRTGYTFKGWSTAAGGAVVALPANITSDLTYYAVWEANDCTITWDLNYTGAVAATATTVKYDSAVTAPAAAPTRTGYTFKGWAATSGASASDVLTTFPAAAGDTTYYAVWEKNTYTVSWYSDADTLYQKNSAKYEDALTAPAAPTRTGYTFKGWSTAAGGAVVALPANITSDLTYYAVWEANDCTITWNLNYTGAAAATSTTVKYDNTVTAPATAPTRTGYTFKGWAASSDATASDVLAAFPAAAGDTTYYAVWEANEYTLSWYPGYPGGAAIQPTTKKYGETITAADMPVPTRTGYTFKDWRDTSGRLLTAGAVVTGNAIYIATWKINTYTITWETDGASQTVPPTTVEYGKSPTAPSVTKTGYTFVGWYDKNDPATVYTGKLPAAAGDTTYCAKWNENAKPDVYYSITWYHNDGTGYETQTSMKENSTITAPTITRTGYTLKGWSTTADGEPVTLPAIITENLKYYAVWEANDCTITWDLNYTDAAAASTTTVKYDSTITKPDTDPVRSGYIFKGWAEKSDAEASDVITTFPAASGDVIYYAVWEEDLGYNYVVKVSLDLKDSKTFHMVPSDDDSKDQQTAKYHVVYDENGDPIADKSEDIELVSVAKDLASGENIDAVLNVIKDISFTYEGTEQTLFDKNGKVNDLIVGYMPIASNLPEGTTDQIVDSIIKDTSIPEEIKEKVNTETVESLLTKLDDGITAETELTEEETVIAQKASEKIDEYIENGTLLEKVKENESISNMVTQLGLSDDDILAMAGEYSEALKAALAGRASGTAETASLMDDTSEASTKGGIAVKINPAKAAKQQYDKGLDWFVDTVTQRLVSDGYMTQAKVDELDFKNSKAVKDIYDLLDPDDWFTVNDGEYSLKGDGEDYEDQVDELVDAVEALRQEYIVGKDAADIAESMKSYLEKAREKSEQAPAVSDDKIDKLAAILVKDKPTLDDLEDAGFTEKEYSLVRDITKAQAISAIERMTGILGSDASGMLSDSLKDSLAERIAGTYKVSISITKEEYEAD